MARLVIFAWKGADYSIPKLTADEATADDGPLAILEELETATTTRQQIAIALRIVEAMHCPPEVRESLAADEIEECLAALNAVQMPKQPKGNGKAVPFEAAGDGANLGTPPVPAGGSSPASPDSTAGASEQ